MSFCQQKTVYISSFLWITFMIIWVRSSRQTVHEESHFGALSAKAEMLRSSGFSKEGTTKLKLLWTFQAFWWFYQTHINVWCKRESKHRIAISFPDCVLRSSTCPAKRVWIFWFTFISLNLFGKQITRNSNMWLHVEVKNW